MSKKVTRLEDMSETGQLLLWHCDDGDIEMLVTSSDGAKADIEFCNSGGRSPHTHKALLELFKAMERDNEEGK